MDAYEQHHADREMLAKMNEVKVSEDGEVVCSECGCADVEIVVEDPNLGEAGAFTSVCNGCLFELHVPAEATSRTRIAAVRAIVRQHSAKRIDGYIVDAITAGMLVAVYDALSPKNREGFGKVPLARLVDIGWKAVK